MSTPMSTSQAWLTIGRIVAPHGLKGELRVQPSSDFPERFTQPGQRWLRPSADAVPQPVKLLSGRYVANKGLYIVRLAEVVNRTQAENLRHSELLVAESDRPTLAAEEFHVADLIGLQVRLQGKDRLVGTIVDVFSAGNDLLAVELLSPTPSADGRSHQTPVLIPFVHEIVPRVDLAAGYVEITPPNGLLPEQ